MGVIRFTGDEGRRYDVCAANPLPVSITGGGSPTGGLTDSELRAAPLEVAGDFYPATQPISGSVSVSGTVPVSGTFWPATQPVSGTVAVSGTVSVTGGLTDAQLRASALPVSIDSMPTTPVTGTFWQATQPVSGTVAVSNFPATQPVSIAATVATRDLKDTARTLFSCATAIAGVTAVTTEALLTMVPTRAGVASGTSTSQAVTSGKTLRIQSITVGYISTSAAVLSMRFALRVNPSGAVAANSPILRIIPVSQQAAALAQAGNEMTVDFPDGLDLSGTMQFGITQLGSATTGTCWASVSGFEY